MSALGKNLDAAITVAQDTGSWLKQHYGNVSYGLKDGIGAAAAAIVSAVDAEAEEKIRDRLTAYDDSIGFRGEETSATEISGTYWLVDPIDGTSHFVRGLPFCTTMISLISEGEVVLAVIYDIARGETYWATKGGGTFKDGNRLEVSRRSLSNAMVSFDTRFGSVANEKLYIQMQRATNGLFNSINAGYEYAMVACGKLDARICFDPYGEDWDYAGGALLVSEAGGMVVNLAGNSTYDFKNHNFIAANSTIVAELQTIVPELFVT